MTSSSENTPDLQQAWHHAIVALSLTASDRVALHHGVGGRTLSGPATTADGSPVWLRVMSAPRPGGKAWNGAALADALVSDNVPRPRLLAEHTWGDAPAFQALMWERMKGTVVSATPDLSAPAKNDAQWWTDLRHALATLETVPAPADRQVFSQAFVHRIPNHLPEIAEAGVDLNVGTWVASHGDLHWANLTRDPLMILDWEGWGLAPLGYDAAVLHAYALPEPETAAEVRAVFADVLDTDAGRLAHLVICAEIIQAAERDSLHARLAPYARRFATEVLTPQ
ncbi:phosphotransferase [Nocardiopsis sp. FIRDI 009]|uniref:phosphotransferase n=1 Tax=Nocardiopsis sp. FIRDI 009 TaxID=714197 RepID=UPI000E26E44C|nr:phosphotransferase [Nocardiopsis sp. FIRDI 009]